VDLERNDLGRICRGGRNHRYETVRNALEVVREVMPDATHIAVHDAKKDNKVVVDGPNDLAINCYACLLNPLNDSHHSCRRLSGICA